MQMATVQWFIKCGLTAAVLLLACGFATARFGHGLQLPSTATRDGSLITLNRYAKEPIPDVVLVGSLPRTPGEIQDRGKETAFWGLSCRQESRRPDQLWTAELSFPSNTGGN